MGMVDIFLKNMLFVVVIVFAGCLDLDARIRLTVNTAINLQTYLENLASWCRSLTQRVNVRPEEDCCKVFSSYGV